MKVGNSVVNDRPRFASWQRFFCLQFNAKFGLLYAKFMCLSAVNREITSIWFCAIGFFRHFSRFSDRLLGRFLFTKLLHVAAVSKQLLDAPGQKT